MAKQKKEVAAKKSYRLEFLLISIFNFVFIGLLSLFLFNFSLFDPFKLAFKDFSISDIYYSKMQSRNHIYKGPLLLVNVENKSRGEIAFLLQRIQEGSPKVVGLDVIFPDRKGAEDDLLKAALSSNNNYVLPFAANFDSSDSASYNNSYFGVQSKSFVNLVGEQREFSTIRSYYPYYKGYTAFSTEILKKFDPLFAAPFDKHKEKRREIRFWGNIQNFRYYNFDEVMEPSFNVAAFKNEIVLLGYMGLSSNLPSTLDEDRFYTPLNEKLAGRSHPDMYGLVLHANIIRMALDKDYVTKLPGWLTWIIAFLITWLITPIFVKWYVFRAMWSHFVMKIIQLVVTILTMYATIVLYANANIKLEPAPILAAVILLSDAVLFYDGLIKSLIVKLGLRINSIYLNGHGH